MLSIQKVFRQNHDLHLHCFTISRLVQKQWTESISEKQSCFVALPFWQARKTIASTQLQNSMLKTSVSEKSNQRNQIAYMPPVFQNDRNLYNHITTTTNKKTLYLFCLKISILCWTQVFIPYTNPTQTPSVLGAFQKRVGRRTLTHGSLASNAPELSVSKMRKSAWRSLRRASSLPPGGKSRSNLYDLAPDSRGFFKGGKGEALLTPRST